MPNDETPRPQDESAASASPPETPAAEEQPEQPDPPEQQNAFKPPVSMLAKAIAELQEGNRGTRDRMLRIAADFENFKKRSRREQQDAVRRAEDKLVIEFLPVLDNLERALQHAESEASPLAEGVRMVQKQFLTLLEKSEIKPFESLGLAFDPERHEAIQQTHSDAPAGTIAQQLQRGYLRGERLVRPALVMVSLGPPKSKDEPAGTKTEDGTDAKDAKA
jgi:molecular chaperone GrpE